MQFANLYLRTAGLAIVALAASSCQTAQKPVSLLPPSPAIRASAPPAQPTRTPEPATAQTSPTAQTEPQPEQKKQAEPAPTSATQTPLEPVSDPIADLVARVEKDYQAGLADYQAGKTDAAKQDFDQAFNTLLGSNFDVKAEPRLEAEFNRIVAGVNRLDSSLTSDGLGGDKDAQAEDQQKSEPAPIDETNEIAPSADPNVKAKAQAEIRSTRSDLPLMMTDQVAGYISYFSNRGRGTFERAFARSGRYHDMMISILKQEGVPQDLIYLAQAESGFHPLAVSRVGARGIWQFMASRARGYGLSHNMYVDDRQDPEKSTRAAAHHLKDLYNQFGDWYLAMAAYNSGPGTVQAAVKRTGYADFWELYRRNVLPKETRNYVPIILAVTIMTKNLSQYGFEDVSMETPAKYDTVTINYPVDLRLVAECVSASQAELQDLNPSLLRLTTPRTGSFELYLPAGTKAEYQEMIATIPVADRLWWRLHTVKPGETLAALSRTYRIPAKTIAEANHLDDHQLEADSRVMIPFSPGKHPSDTATYAKRITRYKVHAGDTVESVADNFGISPQMLRRWNGIRGDSLRGRRVLALHLPITPSSEVDHSASAGKPSPRSKKPVEIAKAEKPVDPSSAETDQTPAVVRHKVKTGETLYSIATYYKTTVAALKRDNQNVAVLRPGMILIVQHGQ